MSLRHPIRWVGCDLLDRKEYSSNKLVQVNRACMQRARDPIRSTQGPFPHAFEFSTGSDELLSARTPCTVKEGPALEAGMSHKKGNASTQSMEQQYGLISELKLILSYLNLDSPQSTSGSISRRSYTSDDGAGHFWTEMRGEYHAHTCAPENSMSFGGHVSTLQTWIILGCTIHLYGIIGRLSLAATVREDHPHRLYCGNTDR